MNSSQDFNSILDAYVVRELEYVDVLANLVKKIENSTIQHDTQMDPFELTGRIDLIYYYHNIQVIPDVVKMKKTKENIIEYFFKHRPLWYMYKNFISQQAIMDNLKIQIKNAEETLAEMYHGDKNIIVCKLKSYADFIENLKMYKICNPVRCDLMLSEIKNIMEEATSKYNESFRLAELIVSETVHVKNLQRNVEKFNAIVFNKTQRYYNKESTLWGQLPELIQSRKRVLRDLENCLYDLDFIDIMNCFKNNIDSFKLYVKHLKSKVPDELENCTLSYPELSSITDISIDRLSKYPIFFKEFMKFELDDDTRKQLEELNSLFENILQDADTMLAVTSILDCNISVFEQGDLFYRNEYVVSSAKMKITKVKLFVFVFEKCIIFAKSDISGKLRYSYHILICIIDQCIPKDTSITLVCKDKDTWKLNGMSTTIEAFSNCLMNILKISYINKQPLRIRF